MVQRSSNAEVMSMELSPKAFVWSPADLPLLGATSVAAAKLHLCVRGILLPSYSDSSKVAYVLQGTGSCGLALPDAAAEKVIPVKEGDALELPLGALTWWHNAKGSSTELVILFLANTSKGYTTGRFAKFQFQLPGDIDIFAGFSTEFFARAWVIDQESADKILSTKPGYYILKIAAGRFMPEPWLRTGRSCCSIGWRFRWKWISRKAAAWWYSTRRTCRW